MAEMTITSEPVTVKGIDAEVGEVISEFQGKRLGVKVVRTK